MKIAFLNMYNGLVDRGAETFVKEVARRLSVKHDVTVFQGGSGKGDEGYQVERVSMNLDLSRTRGGTLFSYLFLDYPGRAIFVFTLKSLKKIFKERYDIVVPVNGGFMPALIRLATWLYGGKMVISGQAGTGWDERNNLWCFPDTFVALSRKAKKWAERANPFVKTSNIPNGVDTKKFTPDGPRFQTSLPRPVVLCVGALTKSKRIDLTVKAVSKLKASLLVVGDGDLRGKIKSLGKRLLGRRFQLTKIPFTEMPRVYRTADVFTLASEPFHAFEIVLVEAMASGLAVVANKDEIRREIVGEGGILVDPTNIEAYAVALENALRIKWGKKPEREAKRFDWDKIAHSYEKLFLKLCSR